MSRWTVSPEHKSPHRPADTYDVLDGDMEVVLASVTHTFAQRLADAHNRSMTGHVKPTAEQIARALCAADPGHRATAEDFDGLRFVDPDVIAPYYVMARAVLALLPGKTEAEVRADECERVAQAVAGVLAEMRRVWPATVHDEARQVVDYAEVRLGQVLDTALTTAGGAR